MSDGAPDYVLPPLLTSVRAVEISDDPVGVHFVVEVSSASYHGPPPEYRATTTVCGQPIYARARRSPARVCGQCQRTLTAAVQSAHFTVRATHSVRDRVTARN